jgi:phytoene dehydrogenase-like protein
VQDYETIVIGAGHNGLVCANYLARAGQKVLVLEASAEAGGLAATREFHPGFKASVAHSLNHFSEKIGAQLRLTEFGYTGAGEALPSIGLDSSGNHVKVHAGKVSGVSEKDARKYEDLLALLKRCAAALEPSWYKTMPRIGNNSIAELLTFAQVGLKLRLLGKQDMREFFRIAALPARDLMDENFDNELLKSLLSWDGLIGSRQAPRSPNHTVLTMLYRLLGKHEGGHSIPEGGIETLIAALVQSAAAAGAELRLNSPVQKVRIDADESGLQASGVELADGEFISAKRVVSATDPRRTFLGLVGAENLEIEFSNRINRIRDDGFVAKLHLALSGEPQFSGVDDARGRMIISPTMDSMEFAWDDAKYGGCPEQPVMEVLVPSLSDSSLAPAGQHVLSAHVMYVPYKLKAGWDEAARNTLREKLIETLCEYAPKLREQILHAELLTPADLERDWNVSGGHWHHGEFAMDQLLMMRPTYGAAQYATPVPGLYLCSAGSHPGGGIMGAAGHNAAREILR